MSIYKYSQSKVIDEVAFITSENGACRGYLHATDQVDPKTLQTIAHSLQEKGWNAIPCTLNNIPVLEVRGIKNASELIGYLEKNGWVSGKSVFKADRKEKEGALDWLKKRTLQAAGMSFIVADTGFVYYGVHEKRWEDVAAGFAYMAGSATMAVFGHSDQSNIEIRKQARKLLGYAKDYDLKIDPEDAITSISAAKNKNGVIELFKEYPAEIGNTVTGIAGLMIALSAAKSRVFKKFDPEKVGHETIENNRKEGILLKPEDAKLTPKELGEKTIRKKRFAGRMDMGLGTSTLIAGMTGAWLPEKVKDEDEPKSHGIKSILDWIQEKPLRVAGYGYMISTLCHAVSTAVEYKDAKLTRDEKSRKAIPGRIGFILFTMIGEILLAISSKGHGEGVKVDKSTDQSIISLAAGLIVRQPESMQEPLIEKLSKFLGRADVLAIKDSDATSQLRTQVEAMRKNPWAFGAKSAPATQKPEAVEVEKKQGTPIEEPKKHSASERTAKPLPGWAGKVSQSADVQPNLSV